MALANKTCMNRQRFASLLIVLATLVTTGGTSSVAQDTRPKSEAEIRALVVKTRSRDLKTSDEARGALSKLDTKSLPALTSILKKGKPCERVAVAQWFIEFDRHNKDLVPAMTDVATGGSLRSLFNLQEEMMCRRGAAFVLAFSPEGIRVLTRLLQEGDLFERQSAIFAFDNLTETSNYPEDSLPVMKEAIPAIAKATREKDQTISCMSDEVLGQIARGANQELSKLAKQYLAGNR
ncbi:MAG: hypothetical protein QOI77_720 [Blastocatellia bacterium]|nr:hypothetical protein [Blastocatellia bacterium]